MLTRHSSLAPVLIRIALGSVFMAHGAPKLLKTAIYAASFAKIGLPAPWLLAVLVGAVELGGGFLLLVGLCTRFVAACLAAIMVGAILLVKFSKGFINGWEFDMVLLAGALSLLLSGPGSLKAA